MTFAAGFSASAVPPQQFTAHIANGATVSDEALVPLTVHGVRLDGYGLTRIIIPATFDGTTITFQEGFDDTAYVPLYNSDGTLLTVTIGAKPSAIALDPSTFTGINFIRVVAGTTQTAARVVTLQGRPL